MTLTMLTTEDDASEEFVVQVVEPSKLNSTAGVLIEQAVASAG